MLITPKTGRIKKVLLTVALMLVMAGGAVAQNIGGIGAQLIPDTTGGFTMPRIFSLVKGSPAWDSLKATDYIMKVNDVSCKDKSIEEIVALIRGEVGTTVRITTADTKQGARPREHELTRVGMNLGPAADPKDAFFAACEKEAQQMKRKGATILKSYNSDCGSFFFNFNAGAGKCYIKITTLADATDKSGKGYTATARVFDNEHENEAVTLSKLDSKSGAGGIATMEGSATYPHDCVGTISVHMEDESRCKAMYVLVWTMP